MRPTTEPDRRAARRTVGRRAFALALATGLLPAGRVQAQSAAPRGLVLPRLAAPDLPLTDAIGRRASLGVRLQGRVTAVQLMFAGCSTTCPVQGAVFAEVARQVRLPEVQLLSLTVDPLGDSPEALAAWLERFGRRSCWTAAAPRVQDVDRLAEFLRGLPPKAGTHSSQVFLFDRQARLAFRTVDLPPVDHVVDLLGQLVRA